MHAVNDPRVSHRGPRRRAVSGQAAGCVLAVESQVAVRSWSRETVAWPGPQAKAHDDGVGGRSLRTRAILSPPWHGVNSSARKGLNWWRATGSSIVKRCVHTSQLCGIGVATCSLETLHK